MAKIAEAPSYIENYNSGQLHEKIRKAHDIMSHCTICPRECGVNRFAGETGF